MLQQALVYPVLPFKLLAECGTSNYSDPAFFCDPVIWDFKIGTFSYLKIPHETFHQTPQKTLPLKVGVDF